MLARTLLTALIVCAPALASAQVSLKHDPAYREGTSVRSEVTVDTGQTLTLGEMDVETSSSMFMITLESVDAKTDDGGWKMRGKFETLQSDISLPGGLEFQFDSGNPDAAQTVPALQAVADLMQTLAKAEWTTVISADGRVKTVKFDGDPLTAVPEAFRSQISPETWKKAANQILDRLPNEPVSKGDSWTRTESSDFGGGQSMTFEKKYTYLGPTEKDGQSFEKIGVESLSVTYKMEPNGVSPVKVTGSDLQIAESEGEVLYNPEAGTITGMKEKVHITGDLELEVNGQTLPGKLDLTIGTTMKSRNVEDSSE
ncbi:hypothetical protein Mal4_49420 [Maioricimonas rarisocia]|uniref:Uncharacterized protein n=1 Tax=Maioricimonas rarisocia TaxID=2528026 RepID=A0A517ZDP4_9PLAN|nr:DUF6263 family protein [Maioricimonas rarisocia]QDU40584.1 hypothetical protein Mal4_49420 [Maioricimonas rarisocia]